MASYKILAALYMLGTDLTLTRERKYLKTELERHRPVSYICKYSDYLVDLGGGLTFYL